MTNAILSCPKKMILCFLLSWTFSSLFAQEGRQHISIDKDWKFALGNATNSAKDFNYGVVNNFSKSRSKYDNFSLQQFNDSSWTAVDLPHDWVISLPFSETAPQTHGYKAIGVNFPENNIGWYRKRIDIDSTQYGKIFQLQFDGVYRNYQVWINGLYVGSHMSGYTAATFNITDFIDYKRPNVITIRVDASIAEGWFYEGAGIYRHAWLNVFGKVHSSPEDVFVYTKSINGGDAQMQFNMDVFNNTFEKQDVDIENKLIDPNGKTVEVYQYKASVNGNEKTSIGKEFAVKNPLLWNLKTPHLYSMVSTVRVAGKVTDVITTKFGIRVFNYTADGFFLNNEKVRIKGLCCHQDHAGVGVAVPDELQYYRLKLIKEMGANAYRASHNPPTPELLTICDSLGILVMDETRLLNSGNEYLSQFESLIKRDRNHASIFMWIIGNEEDALQTHPEAKAIGSTMVNIQKYLDPSRTSTFGANVGNVYSGVNEVIPVRGFNYFLSGIEPYKKDHPQHPIISTELASTVSTRGAYPSSKPTKTLGHYKGDFIADLTKNHVIDQDYSYTSWASTAEKWLSLTMKFDWFMGGFVWTGFDYKGEPTPFSWPSTGSNFGVMDACGFPKNVYYYYKSWWSPEDVLHIACNWKPTENNEPVSVWVYSNAQTVELFLNKKSLGKKEMPLYGHLNWEVPYAKGKLEAVGYRNGKRIQSSIETNTGTAKLKLEPHKTYLNADGNDVVVVNVTALDKSGRPVPDAMNQLDFTVSGDAKIIGLGNGDPASHENDKPVGDLAVRTLFNGKCQVIVQAGHQKQNIQLNVKAKELPASVLSIKQGL